MSEQANNLLLLDQNGDVRALKADDSLKIGVPFTVAAATDIQADLKVGGDLTVAGDIVSRGSTNVVSKDPVIDLGLGDYSGTAQAGGFTVSVNKAAGFAQLTVTAFQSKASAVGDANFTVADAATLTVGMVVAISGSFEGSNDGYYVVKSKAGGKVSVEPTAMQFLPFAQTDFTTVTEPAGDKCKVYNVDLGVVLISDGTYTKTLPGITPVEYWEIGTLVKAYVPAATKALFQANGTYQAPGEVSLHEAYVFGNTITTSSGEGNVVIEGTEKLWVSATNGVRVDNLTDLNGSVDIDLPAGGTFAVDGHEQVLFGQSTGLDLFKVTTIGGGAGAGNIEFSNNGMFDINSSGKINMDAATGGVSIQGSGAEFILKSRGQNMTVASTLSGITDIASATEVQVTTALFDVNASGSVQIDAGAASNFYTSVGDLHVRAAASLILEGKEAAADAVRIHASDAAGGIDIDANTLTLDTAAGFSIDGASASNVSVTGGNLTLSTITSGGVIVAAQENLNMSSVAEHVTIDAEKSVSIDAKANSNLSVTGANLDIQTLTSGNMSLSSQGTMTQSSVNAFSIDSTSAGVSIGAVDDSDFAVAGADKSLKLEASGGGNLQQVKVLSAGTAYNAVHLSASAGGVDIAAQTSLTALAKKTSHLKMEANIGTDEILTIAATNAGAGKATLELKGEDSITATVTAGSMDVFRDSAGDILTVKKVGASKAAFQVSDTMASSIVPHLFSDVAGVPLVAGASISAGLVCAFDASGKMVAADSQAGSTSPTAAQEVLRYPFAMAAVSLAVDAKGLFQTVPGAKAFAAFDTAPAAGLIGQPVYLAGGADAGKLTLTAPTASNASIWRVGILAGTAATSGLFPVYWHPQYLGRRPNM